MIELQIRDALEEIIELIEDHKESSADLDDDDRLSAAEDMLQDIADKLSLLADPDE